MSEDRRAKARQWAREALKKARSAVKIDNRYDDMRRIMDLAEAVNLLTVAVELLVDECHELGVLQEDNRGDGIEVPES